MSQVEKEKKAKGEILCSKYFQRSCVQNKKEKEQEQVISYQEKH